MIPPAQAEAEGTAAATQSRPALTPPEPPAPQPAAARSRGRRSRSTDASLEFNPASTNINEVFIEATPGERTGTFESIVLVGDDAPGAAEPAEEEPVLAPQAQSAPDFEPAAADPSALARAAARRDAEARSRSMSTWSSATACGPAAAGFTVSAAAARQRTVPCRAPEPVASRRLTPEDTAPDDGPARRRRVRRLASRAGPSKAPLRS